MTATHKNHGLTVGKSSGTSSPRWFPYSYKLLHNHHELQIYDIYNIYIYTHCLYIIIYIYLDISYNFTIYKTIKVVYPMSHLSVIISAYIEHLSHEKSQEGVETRHSSRNHHYISIQVFGDPLLVQHEWQFGEELSPRCPRYSATTKGHVEPQISAKRKSMDFLQLLPFISYKYL